MIRLAFGKAILSAGEQSLGLQAPETEKLVRRPLDRELGEAGW